MRSDGSVKCRKVGHRTHLFDGNDEIHFGTGRAIELAECLLVGPVIPVPGSQGVIDVVIQALEVIPAVLFGNKRLNYETLCILQLHNRARK